MKNYVLHSVQPEDTALKEYVKENPFITDIKLVHTPGPRKPNTWTAIAIKFKNRKQKNLLSMIVDLRADEYWGKLKGYHVLWWD